MKILSLNVYKLTILIKCVLRNKYKVTVNYLIIINVSSVCDKKIHKLNFQSVVKHCLGLVILIGM